MTPSGDWDRCSDVFQLSVEGIPGYAFEIYNSKSKRGRSLWFGTKKQAEDAQGRWIEFYLDCIRDEKGAA